MKINNNYKTDGWDGGKYFVLTTSSPFGGQNYTLPVIMMLIGFGALFAGLFIVRQMLQLRALESDNR